MNAANPVQAVVLSGGGAYGAYEIGVLQALLHGKSSGTQFKPFEPDVFCGTSIGSFNAAFLVSRWDTNGVEALNHLEEVWRQQLCHSGRLEEGISSFRLRLNLFDLVRPGCYRESVLLPPKRFLEDALFLGMSFTQRLSQAVINNDISFLERMMGLFNMSDFISVEPWAEVIAVNVDFAALPNAGKALRVAATNWNKGEVRVFDNRHMQPGQGVRILLASSALPGLFPPVLMGSQQFVDGGVLMNTPLKPAISANADVIHVINMEGSIDERPLAAPANTMDTFYRQQLVGWGDTIERDMDRVRSYNIAIDHILSEGGGQANFPTSLKALIFRLGKGADVTRKYRKLTIHLYRPKEALGGLLGLLDLRPRRINEHIENGYNDAVTHNCDESGCILAGATP